MPNRATSFLRAASYGGMALPADKVRVLVIDDEPIVAKTLAIVFSNAGYETRAVESAEAAIALLETEQWVPQFAIIDVHLPGMNGIDLATMLKAHYPQVRFVSDTIRGVDPRHFLIQGVLEIRGIRRPLTLDATLERERTNMANGDEIADFSVSGTLHRSDYGMTSQRIMISDQVTLQIAARIELPPQTK